MRKVIYTLLIALLCAAGLASCASVPSTSASDESPDVASSDVASSDAASSPASSSAPSATASSSATAAVPRDSEPLEKQQANLGFLEDAEGNLVLLMNTEVNMTTVRESLKSAMEESAREQLLVFHRLIDSHHFYDDESGQRIINVAYLNEHFGEGPVKVDQALFDTIAEALDMTELTQGYFNPTVGKLVEVYEGRFSATGEVGENPRSEDVAVALESVVPYEHIRECILLDSEALTVELVPFEGRDFALTLSAIGKGFALNALGFEHDTSYLLTAGASSIRTHVAPSEDDISWNVATRVPDTTDLLLAFNLDNGSVSVSGDDENYYLLEDGTRVHHILNPFTGYSENYYRTIILTGQDAGVLDALSTALFNIADEDELVATIERVEEHYGIAIDYCFVRQGSDEGSFALSGSESFFDRLIPEYTNAAVDEDIKVMGA